MDALNGVQALFHDGYVTRADVAVGKVNSTATLFTLRHAGTKGQGKPCPFFIEFASLARVSQGRHSTRRPPAPRSRADSTFLVLSQMNRFSSAVQLFLTPNKISPLAR